MVRWLAGMLVLMTMTSGCAMPKRTMESGFDASFRATEPAWIREGEAIEIEMNTWVPTDEVERLLDSEMIPIGQYRETVVFIERVDVKPYARMYTRYERGRYRVFEPQS